MTTKGLRSPTSFTLAEPRDRPGTNCTETEKHKNVGTWKLTMIGNMTFPVEPLMVEQSGGGGKWGEDAASVDRSPRLTLPASPAHILELIVGLNVATKGAPPFSRGKRVVPHHTKITM